MGIEESLTASISASIIQGSGVGPAAFTVKAADLKSSHPGSSLVKFADDTYLVVPSVNAGTRQQKMDNIATWAAANNLKLNALKSIEIHYHCNFICDLSDVIIKTFSQSVSQSVSQPASLETPRR